MESKGFAVVIMAMVPVMLCSLVFRPINLSLPYQLIIPFIPSHTLSMFFLCNAIIVALILTTHFGSPKKSNGVTAYDDQHHVFTSTESFYDQRMLNSENEHSTEQMKFICSAEDAGAEEKYGHSKSKKLGCRDIVNYTENWQVDDKFMCSSVPNELMQVVEVPAVTESKKFNELASMIDEDLDFNRRVE